MALNRFTYSTQLWVCQSVQDLQLLPQSSLNRSKPLNKKSVTRIERSFITLNNIAWRKIRALTAWIYDSNLSVVKYCVIMFKHMNSRAHLSSVKEGAQILWIAFSSRFTWLFVTIQMYYFKSWVLCENKKIGASSWKTNKLRLHDAEASVTDSVSIWISHECNLFEAWISRTNFFIMSFWFTA